MRQALAEIGEASTYRKPDTQVTIVAAETPWATRYKIKAYVTESREQFAMITGLTIRGKERLRATGILRSSSLRRNQKPLNTWPV